MTAIVAATLIALASQSPQGATELRSLALRGTDSALVEGVRRRPDDVREALRVLMKDESLDAAARLAGSWAGVWRDSFLLRQVARFRSLSPSARAEKLAADSVRLLGNALLTSEGPTAAMDAWRVSLRRAESSHDTAGIAAAMGNLGAGYYRAQAFDSATSYLTGARRLAIAIGDYRTAANAVGALGSVHQQRGERRAAAELYRQASTLRTRVGDDRGLAADQQNLGVIAREMGDWPGARAAWEAALEANRRAGRTGPAATNLLNLGNLASHEGEYPLAETRYREALAAWRGEGSDADAAGALHALGLLAMRRGHYAEAVRRLSEAVATLGQTGPLAEEIAARRDLAAASAAAGNLQEARRQLRTAENRVAGSPASSALRASLALARGDLAVRFNQLREAEQHYRRSEQLARAAGDDLARAEAQQGLGIVLLIRRNYAGGLAALQLALRSQQSAADARGAALSRLLAGYAHRELGDTAAARRATLYALDTLDALGDRGSTASALAALAELEMRHGLPQSAESLYRRGLERLGPSAAPDVSWRLRAGLAGALRARGAADEAARELRLAVGHIERLSSGLTTEERRAAFLADKWDVFVDLALLERARGRIEAAFAASEQLRARQLLDLLVRGRVVSAAPSGALAEREQDLRRRIAELATTLESTATGERGVRGPPVGEQSAALREALSQAQERYGALLTELRESQPEYAATVRGEITSARDVRNALAPDQAMLEYLVGDSTTVVFVVTSDTVAAFDLNVPRQTLADLIDYTRGILESPAAGSRPAWRTPLRRLGRHLIAPVEASGLLAGKRRLLIAPHVELHYVPFAALELGASGSPLLIERYVVEYVTSASVWLRLRQRPPRTGSGMFAMAPRADALPGSRAEVAAITRLHGFDAHLLAGAAATESVFRDMAPRFGVVHLATYGVLNKQNPLFSFVELAAGAGEDGRLEVHEVFSLSLNASLLVLSACQTGLGSGALADVPAGDDWVGLVQAFLAAGAGNVMATLWPVADAATSRLMERFYRERSAGRSDAEALAEMQRAALRRPDTAHPFYWAGFALVTGQ